jgi:transaldolase
MLFIDSSDPEEIRPLAAWGVLGGCTTNPLLFARESADHELEPRVREILAVAPGSVSVELVSETSQAMLEEALTYHAWSPSRICIKVPFGEQGLPVLHQLHQQGVSTNATCLMSFNQAYLAALAGATYVSIFAGRIRDMGYDAYEIIASVREQLEREQLASKIIVGSVRQMMDVNDALQAGAHIVTVPPAILRKMVWNPRTEETIREFNSAWASRKSKAKSSG